MTTTKTKPANGAKVVKLKVGSLLGRIDWSQLNADARAKKEEAEIRRLQIADAEETAVELIAAIGDTEHFFVAGDPGTISTAREHKGVMDDYHALLSVCRAHFDGGSVEIVGEDFSVSEEKPHCVVAARLAGLRELTKLSSSSCNEQVGELRGLTRKEVEQIAENLGIIRPEPIVTHDEAQEALAIMNSVKWEANLPKPKPKVTLTRRATIEEAISHGGEYLATIPVGEHEGRLLPGGKLFLQFDAGRGQCVTIIGEEGQFSRFASELRMQSAMISIEMICDLIDRDPKEPAERILPVNHKLWWLIKRHCRWLKEERKELDSIALMAQDGDLSTTEWAEGEIGTAVLTLPEFSSGKIFSDLPVAIRFSREEVAINGVASNTLTVVEVSPRLLHSMSSLTGKTFPEGNIHGHLKAFVEQWNSQNKSAS